MFTTREIDVDITVRRSNPHAYVAEVDEQVPIEKAERVVSNLVEALLGFSTEDILGVKPVEKRTLFVCFHNCMSAEEEETVLETAITGLDPLSDHGRFRCTIVPGSMVLVTA